MPPIARPRTDPFAGPRLPPANHEAEMGVLGSILIDGAMLHEVRPLLRPDDFWRDDLATIYREVLRLADANRPVDVVTLAEALMQAGRFEDVGGNDILVAIVESVPHAAHARYYADIVLQKARQRELIVALTESLTVAYGNDRTAEEMLAFAQGRVLAVGEGRDSGRVVTLGEAAKESMRRLGQRELGVEAGLFPGFFDLSLLTGLWQPGQLIVLAARPSIGKSAIALNIADYLSTDLEPAVATLFVSLEMPAEELADRALVGRAGIDGSRFLSGNLLGADRRALERALERVDGSRLFLADAPAQELGAIAALARRYRARERIGLLVIDYLQLVEPGEVPRGTPRHEVVGTMTRSLKNLAKAMGIPVLLLAQLNREVEKREGKKPQLSDLRESGSIEQDADKVLLLHRPDFYDPENEPGAAYVIVAKNRGGPTGEVKLRFHKATTTFAPWDEPLPDGHPLAAQPF